MQHAVDRIVMRLVATIAGTVERIETRCRRRHLERQLNALDDRTLADIGITGGQIPAIASAFPDAPRLLRRMIERLGLASETLLRDSKLRSDMAWNCIVCPSRTQCHRWLKSTSPADGYRSFCPNAEGLDRLLAARALSD